MEKYNQICACELPSPISGFMQPSPIRGFMQLSPEMFLNQNVGIKIVEPRGEGSCPRSETCSLGPSGFSPPQFLLWHVSLWNKVSQRMQCWCPLVEGKRDTRNGKKDTSVGQRLKQIKRDYFGKGWRWRVHSATQKDSSGIYWWAPEGYWPSETSTDRLRQVCLPHSWCVAWNCRAQPRDVGAGTTADSVLSPAESKPTMAVGQLP